MPGCPGVKRLLPISRATGKHTLWCGRPWFSVWTSMTQRFSQKVIYKKSLRWSLRSREENSGTFKATQQEKGHRRGEGQNVPRWEGLETVFRGGSPREVLPPPFFFCSPIWRSLGFLPYQWETPAHQKCGSCMSSCMKGRRAVACSWTLSQDFIQHQCWREKLPRTVWSLPQDQWCTIAAKRVTYIHKL